VPEAQAPPESAEVKAEAAAVKAEPTLEVGVAVPPSDSEALEVNKTEGEVKAPTEGGAAEGVQMQDGGEVAVKPAISDLASLEAEIEAAQAALVPADVTVLLRGKNTPEQRVSPGGRHRSPGLFSLFLGLP
jgi:hypothetical protein